jgi:hypothetical protein
MSTLILSLLLLLLIAAGMLMAKPIHEHFVDAQVEETVQASPTLLNMIRTPQLAPKVQVDTLARDQDVKEAMEHPKCPTCPECPKQKECPDMSQYIRYDEIPCWNCSLP